VPSEAEADRAMEVRTGRFTVFFGDITRHCDERVGVSDVIQVSEDVLGGPYVAPEMAEILAPDEGVS
jgi:hypothetical protein